MQTWMRWIVLGAALMGCNVRESAPRTPDSFFGFPFNGGRTQAITVNPLNSNEVIIANQFGGMWHTGNLGNEWDHVDGLQAVLVADVQYGDDGTTVVATLREDTQTDNGGGIYVSRDGGSSWTRPMTGVIPSDTRTPARGSAWGISVSPDNPNHWYVGTSFGVARSLDNGATWTHLKVDPSLPVSWQQRQDAVNSITVLRNGVILALLDNGVYRSDDQGNNWTISMAQDLSAFNHWTGFNKLERDRSGTHAYAVENYETLHYYEAASDDWTTLALPSGGGSRGPFVRVSDVSPALRAFDIFGISRDWEIIWSAKALGSRSRLAAAPPISRACSLATGFCTAEGMVSTTTWETSGSPGGPAIQAMR